jgi:hypothetical protein
MEVRGVVVASRVKKNKEMGERIRQCVGVSLLHLMNYRLKLFSKNAGPVSTFPRQGRAEFK